MYILIILVCLCLTSLQQRGHLETAPHLLSLAKDVKLNIYTVPTGSRIPGRRVAVHYATAAPPKLHLYTHCKDAALENDLIITSTINIFVYQRH